MSVKTSRHTGEETNPARLKLMRKAASVWSDMDLNMEDSRDYAELYMVLRKIYLKYDP